MNVIYGFGGMRSDGEMLSFRPNMPHKWNGYSFTITVKGNILKVEVSKNRAIFTILQGENIKAEIYDKEYEITKEGVEVEY